MILKSQTDQTADKKKQQYNKKFIWSKIYNIKLNNVCKDIFYKHWASQAGWSRMSQSDAVSYTNLPNKKK